MNNGAEKIIEILSPEIQKKCLEIKQNRIEKRYSHLFIMLCGLIIIIPTMFVFFGISLISLLIPVIFLGIAFLILSPILINQQGERVYE